MRRPIGGAAPAISMAARKVTPMYFLIRRIVRYFRQRKQQGAPNPQDPQGS
jgi:hypothetical protein